MKIKDMLKENIRLIVGIIIGAILFGSIGTVIATNIASSSVDYTTNKNSNIGNVEAALDDLYNQIIGYPITCYNGTCGKLSYRYWNDGFINITHQSNAISANNYATRELLEQNYGSSNFTSRPYYIRSILIDGTVVGHQVCLWKTTNNKEFCMSNGYWAGTLNTEYATAGTLTKTKLKRDMQDDFGVTIADSSCSSSGTNVYCFVGDFDCSSYYSGYVGCGGGNARCYVDGDGSAQCNEW